MNVPRFFAQLRVGPPEDGVVGTDGNLTVPSLAPTGK